MPLNSPPHGAVPSAGAGAVHLLRRNEVAVGGGSGVQRRGQAAADAGGDAGLPAAAAGPPGAFVHVRGHRGGRRQHGRDAAGGAPVRAALGLRRCAAAAAAQESGQGALTSPHLQLLHISHHV